MADPPGSTTRVEQVQNARAYTPRQLQEYDVETAQQSLRLQFASVQKRAQELMVNMNIPGAHITG